MIRAVLDANVLVSASFTAKTPPGQILDAWRARRFTTVFSDAILAEVGRVFRYPKIQNRHRWPEPRVRLFLRHLRRLSVLTPGTLQVHVVAEDPDDDKYLACALEGGAGYLVTGDRHLLGLKQYRGVRILSPRSFLEIIRRGATRPGLPR